MPRLFHSGSASPSFRSMRGSPVVKPEVVSAVETYLSLNKAITGFQKKYLETWRIHHWLAATGEDELSVAIQQLIEQTRSCEVEKLREPQVRCLSLGYLLAEIKDLNDDQCAAVLDGLEPAETLGLQKFQLRAMQFGYQRSEVQSPWFGEEHVALAEKGVPFILVKPEGHMNAAEANDVLVKAFKTAVAALEAYIQESKLSPPQKIELLTQWLNGVGSKEFGEHLQAIDKRLKSTLNECVPKSSLTGVKLAVKYKQAPFLIAALVAAHSQEAAAASRP